MRISWLDCDCVNKTLDDDWADLPLTEQEESELKQGRENIKNGYFLTLSEL